MRLHSAKDANALITDVKEKKVGAVPHAAALLAHEQADYMKKVQEKSNPIPTQPNNTDPQITHTNTANQKKRRREDAEDGEGHEEKKFKK